MHDSIGLDRGERLARTPGLDLYRTRPAAPRGAALVQVGRPDRAEAQRRAAHLLSAATPLSVPTLREVVELADRVALVFDDPGAVPLSSLLGACDTERLLRVSVALAEALAAVHAAGVLHRGLRPEICLYDAAGDRAWFVGFDRALHGPAAAPPRELAGALDDLAWIAPEQTGRMNRAVDARADLYALGCVLYALASGAPPFEAEDAMGWVHAHIARRPRPLDAPPTWAAVVERLMAKTVEDRYQTALGLASDLRRCLDGWCAEGQVPVFDLGARDRSSTLRVPQRLVGREPERAALLGGFDRVDEGAVEIALVVGEPGIGKSRLIDELYRPLTQRQGRVLADKAEQYARAEPYHALLGALRTELRRLLSLPDAALEQVRERLQRAVGEGAAALVGVLPDLGLLLGPQPSAPALGRVEAQNRFRLALARLVRGLAEPGRPLVLLLDDLQWVDAPTLALLAELVTDLDTRGLYLVCGMRPAEAHARPVVERWIEAMDGARPLIRVALGPLGVGAVASLVAEAVHFAEGADALGALVAEKTGGNPFFVGRFLRSLHEDGLLAFDEAAGGWRWDQAALAARPHTDNVLDLMTGRIERLPLETVRALQVAACVGGSFEPARVAAALERGAEHVTAALAPAVALGLVTTAERGRWAFVHDRVQEAARGTLDQAARVPLHLRLARDRLADAADVGEHIFEVAEHYQAAEPAVEDPAERAHAADICLQAGRRARDAGAFDAARAHCEGGLRFLGAEGWSRHPELTRELHVGLAEAALAGGDPTAALALTEQVLAHTDDVFDRARVHELRIDVHEAQLEHERALDEAQAVLELLGFPIRPLAGPDDFEARLRQLSDRLRALGPDGVVDLAQATDPAARAAARILNALYAIVNIGRSSLLGPVLFAALDLSLDYGVTPDAPAAFTQLAAVLCARGDYETGYSVGRQSERLRERFPPTAAVTSLRVAFPIFVQHWREPIAPVVASLARAADEALELGDPRSFGHCANQLMVHAVLGGEPLPQVDARYAELSVRLARHQQQVGLANADAWGQVVSCLRGEAQTSSLLVGARCDYSATMARFDEADLFLLLAFVNAAQVALAGWTRDAARVLAVADLGAREALFDQPPNTARFAFVVRAWFRALAHLDLCRAPEGADAALAAVAADVDRVRRWADGAPHNHGHRLALLEAEQARVRGDEATAMAAYARAAAAAAAAGLALDEALVLELAADFHAGAGRARAARGYLEDAVARWRAAGATANVDRLGASVEHTAVASLDVETVLRISDAVTHEVELERLLTAVARTVLQSAGAQRVFLFLDHDGEPRLQARCTSESDAVQLFEGTAVDACAGLVPEVVHFVVRAREAILLPDALRSARFGDHSSVRRDRPRSVLCLPLEQRGQRMGVLYLANDLVPGAFGDERVELLRVFTALAATSIANAVLLRDAREAQAKVEAQNEALTALDRMRDSFLARTSHELRTPLNAIIGLTESVIESTPAASGESHPLRLVVSSARRLSNLIDDLLDVSRLSQGQLRVERGAVDAGATVQRVVQLLRPLVRDDVALLDSVEDGLPPVLADPDRLEQVLTILVDNAIKFTRHGSIEVGARALDDETVELFVEDTGVGLDPAAKDRIFDAFAQGDERIARSFGGAGLGLSIARQLLELHETSIEVESAPGRGARFTFALARARGVEALRGQVTAPPVRRPVERDTMQMAPVVATSDEGRGYNVLVVDDEPANLRVVLNNLGRLGYQVSIAYSGPEALDQIDAGVRPHLVLLDVMMPEMDGLEVCRRLRARYTRNELPIVMVTARTEVPDVVTGLDAGANDYLGKPFSGDELRARMRTHLHLANLHRSVARFVPHRFLELLGRDSLTDVRLGDAVRRDMTVLFADLKGFSAQTRTLEPGARFDLLNEHLALIEPIVIDHGGVVDKFVGDAVMAVFDRTPADAVEAGVAMLRKVALANAQRVAQGARPIELGIGLNTGPLMLGTVGTESRMDTTVISDAVGLAHRVEGLTRPYRSGLLLTQSTREALDEPLRWATRLIDVFTLDDDAPTRVYEVYEADEPARRLAKRATQAAFERGVQAFHAREVEEATAQFRLCRALDGGDPATRLYLDRCARIEEAFVRAG